MHRNLLELRKKLNLSLYEKKKDVSLAKFSEEKVIIFADYREKGSGVIKELAESNVTLNLERLEYADYVLSSRCGVEIKTVEDFVDSIIDGRLLQQIKNLKNNFESLCCINRRRAGHLFCKKRASQCNPRNDVPRLLFLMEYPLCRQRISRRLPGFCT